MSPGPKVQFLLVGRDTSFTLCMTCAGNTRNENNMTTSQRSLIKRPTQKNSRRSCAPTILINQELKAIFPEDFEVIHEHCFTDGGKVKILWPAEEHGTCVTSLDQLNENMQDRRNAQSTHTMSLCPCNTVCCCNISKLYFSSVACWSTMKRSEFTLVMMKPRLNCPMISIFLNMSLLKKKRSQV